MLSLRLSLFLFGLLIVSLFSATTQSFSVDDGLEDTTLLSGINYRRAPKKDHKDPPCSPKGKKPKFSAIKDDGAGKKLPYTAEMIKKGNEKHSREKNNDGDKGKGKGKDGGKGKGKGKRQNAESTSKEPGVGVLEKRAGHKLRNIWDRKNGMKIGVDKSNGHFWNWNYDITEQRLMTSNLSGCTVAVVTSPFAAIMIHVWERRDDNFLGWLLEPYGPIQQELDIEFLNKGVELLDKMLAFCGGNLENGFNGWFPADLTTVVVVGPAANPDYENNESNPWFTKDDKNNPARFIYKEQTETLLNSLMARVAPERQATQGQLHSYRRRYSDDNDHGGDDREFLILEPMIFSNGEVHLNMMYDDDKAFPIASLCCRKADRSKRRKLRTFAPEAVFWDNLSKVCLTKSALRELDRRNARPLPVQNHELFDHQIHDGLQNHHETSQFTPEFPCGSGPDQIKEIKRLSRLGGPDLSALRNHPVPRTALRESIVPGMSPSHRRERHATSPPPSSTTPDTRSVMKFGTTTAYCPNFEQHLIDHGVYPPLYEYPDGQEPPKPDNLEDITERLGRRRSSLSDFSRETFKMFAREDMYVIKEKPIMASVVPTIEGYNGDPKCVAGECIFNNLAPLTNGSSHAKPDHFYGARPEQLNQHIRKELGKYIIPSPQDSLPLAPNFFLETKGPGGSVLVALRQACYDGALGARGIHSLQSYKQETPIYDNNAYTITSIYHAGVLRLYASHPVAPATPTSGPEYVMTSLGSWSLTGDLKTFQDGASAYRNARDWAKEKRDEFIKLANQRYSAPQSQNGPTLQSQPASDAFPCPRRFRCMRRV